MQVRTSLHSHTADGSHDASLAERDMAQAYADAGFGPTAVTDHDTRTPTPGDRLAGIEHSIDHASYLHVVEIENRFSYLAHPARPFPDDTKRQAIAFVRDHGLDGVEKYSRGVEQYPGRIDSNSIVELANDDAHNQHQIGLSYMTVDVPEPTPEAVLRAVERGDVELVNAPDRRRAVIGSCTQALEITTSHIGSTGARRYANHGIP